MDNGSDMHEDPNYKPEPYKDERIAKHEISEEDRRKIYQEQCAAYKSYKNRGRLLNNVSSYAPNIPKDNRIAKHEISEEERRRIYEQQ